MNLTSDQAGLLARVLADPSDDNARRLYADACRDAGDDARGEFIDVQVRLAEIERGQSTYDEWCMWGGDAGCRRDPPCEFHALKRRERALLEARGREWSPGSTLGLKTYGHAGNGGGHITDPFGAGWRWSRGFVVELRLPWPACRDHLDSVRREQPVERVVLTTWPTFSDCNEVLGTNFSDPDNPKSCFRLCGVEIETVPNSGARGLLVARWPNVVFELPPEPASDFLDFRDFAGPPAFRQERDNVWLNGLNELS